MDIFLLTNEKMLELPFYNIKLEKMFLEIIQNNFLGTSYKLNDVVDFKRDAANLRILKKSSFNLVRNAKFLFYKNYQQFGFHKEKN